VKDLLDGLIGKKVKLLKDDNFCITGEITKVSTNSILFFTDGREILLSFSRIKEIVPVREQRYR
jgi:hypothetical protein